MKKILRIDSFLFGLSFSFFFGRRSGNLNSLFFKIALIPIVYLETLLKKNATYYSPGCTFVVEFKKKRKEKIVLSSYWFSAMLNEFN